MQLKVTAARVGSSKIIGIVTALIVLGSCQSTETLLNVPLHYEKLSFSNGLTLLLIEDHSRPVISYQTWFRVGSVDEKPGQTGIAHLFEHLMFKGTPKYGPKQFFEQLETQGAEVNAFTTRDYTVYHHTIVPELLEKVIDMESDRLSHLSLDEAALKTERMVVFEERRMRTESVPDGRLQEALWALAYRTHPYSWPVIGYPQDLLRLTVEDLRDFFGKYYQPRNAAVVITGDFDRARTLALLHKFYDPIAGRPRPARNIELEREQTEERRLVLRDRVTTERLGVAYHISAADNPDSYAMDVLSNILFEGTSSRAYRRIVEDKNLAISVSGSSFTPAYPGLLMIASTLKKRVPASQVENEIQKLMEEVQEKGVTLDEVRVAVKQLTVQVLDSVRTPSGLGQLFGTVETLFGDPKRIVSDLNKYMAVTPADVQRVAQKYLVPNNRSIVTLVPAHPTEKSYASR